MKIDWNKVNYPDLAFERFPSRRSVVFGAKGVVAASQPLAVEAGLEILRKGGNAGVRLPHSLPLTIAHSSFLLPISNALIFVPSFKLWPYFLGDPVDHRLRSGRRCCDFCRA
jgi:hypothetical protein